MSLIDIKGQRFGRLTVIEKLPNEPGVKASIWRCRCDCGRETTAQGAVLRKGQKQSCGCLRSKTYRSNEVCEYCGIPVHQQYHRFCSKSCAAKARCGTPKVEVDDSIDWKKVNGRYRCPYQRFVSCTDRDCANCGWNPEVAAKRSEKILKKLRGAMA